MDLQQLAAEEGRVMGCHEDPLEGNHSEAFRLLSDCSDWWCRQVMTRPFTLGAVPSLTNWPPKPSALFMANSVFLLFAWK